MTGDTTTFDVVHQFLPGVRTHLIFLIESFSGHTIRILCSVSAFSEGNVRVNVIVKQQLIF